MSHALFIAIHLYSSRAFALYVPLNLNLRYPRFHLQLKSDMQLRKLMEMKTLLQNSSEHENPIEKFVILPCVHINY